MKMRVSFDVVSGFVECLAGLLDNWGSLVFVHCLL
jgi:hypothetical protein